MSVQNKRKLPVSSILMVLAFIMFIVTWLFYHTTLFVSYRPGVEDYLSAEEYRLYDSHNSSEDILRSLSDVGYNTSLISSNDLRHTSRGIRPGASWEEFVDAYGDVRARSFNAYDFSDPDEHSDEYYDTHYVYDMTVREYDEQYIKTGVIDMEKEELNIVFSFDTQGTNLAYTEQEREQMLDRYYDSYFSFGFIHGSFYPAYHSVSMDFSFYPPYETDGYDTPVLYSISIYKW